MDGEPHTAFHLRFVRSPQAQQAYGSIALRAPAAEQAWEAAKAQSLVSITTSTTECLLFGRLED